MSKKFITKFYKYLLLSLFGIPLLAIYWILDQLSGSIITEWISKKFISYFGITGDSVMIYATVHFIELIIVFLCVIIYVIKQAGVNALKNNNLIKEMDMKQAAPKQLVLDLGVEIQKDVNGIEMGVLENGIPFLTQIGLAKLVGVARSVIFTISQEWATKFTKVEPPSNRPIIHIIDFLNKE